MKEVIQGERSVFDFFLTDPTSTTDEPFDLTGIAVADISVCWKIGTVTKTVVGGTAQLSVVGDAKLGHVQAIALPVDTLLWGESKGADVTVIVNVDGGTDIRKVQFRKSFLVFLKCA